MTDNNSKMYLYEGARVIALKTVDIEALKNVQNEPTLEVPVVNETLTQQSVSAGQNFGSETIMQAGTPVTGMPEVPTMESANVFENPTMPEVQPEVQNVEPATPNIFDNPVSVTPQVEMPVQTVSEETPVVPQMEEPVQAVSQESVNPQVETPTQVIPEMPATPEMEENKEEVTLKQVLEAVEKNNMLLSRFIELQTKTLQDSRKYASTMDAVIEKSNTMKAA